MVDGVTKTTDAAGQVCFDGLGFSEYTVHENVPAGYVVDENDKVVAVGTNANCDDEEYGGETVAFHNTPLTDVTLSVESQIPGGTASVIVCKARRRSRTRTATQPSSCQTWSQQIRQ